MAEKIKRLDFRSSVGVLYRNHETEREGRREKKKEEEGEKRCSHEELAMKMDLLKQIQPRQDQCGK